MEYTELATDEQYRMLAARLKQYEQRHFDASLNLAAAEATDKPQQAAELKAQIDDLEVVAGLTRDRLETMTPPPETSARAVHAI